MPCIRDEFIHLGKQKILGFFFFKKKKFYKLLRRVIQIQFISNSLIRSALQAISPDIFHNIYAKRKLYK